MDILSSPLLTTSIALESVGSPLHPCATSLLSLFSILVSLFLSFFFISYPFSYAYLHHSTSPPTLVLSPIANASHDLFNDHPSPHFHFSFFLFLTKSNGVGLHLGTFSFLSSFALFFYFYFYFFYSFSTYLFHPNYLLFYRYLFQNVGLFVYFSFLFSTLIYCMDE